MKPTVTIMRIIAVAVLTFLSHTAYATPALLPETAPTWKNIAVDGRKTTVFCIYTDSRGLVWAGTDNGLYFYDGVAARPVDREGMAGVQVYAIVERDGTLYLGTNNGLRAYGFDGTETVCQGMPKEIRALLRVDDTLWVAGLEGVSTLDFNSGKVRSLSTGLPHRSVYSMLRDSRGILYAGTYDGLARWNPAKGMFQEVPSPRTGNGQVHNFFINCMLEADDGQSIYIGSEGALLRYSPAGERWDTLAVPSGNNVKCLARAPSTGILAGTDDGIFEIRDGLSGTRQYRHDSRNTHTLPDNEIWCVSADGDGNIWAGHGKGMSIASDSGRMRAVGIGSLLDSGEGNEIHSICRDSRGNLWFGGTGGMIRVDAGDGRPTWYRHSAAHGSLSHNRVRDIKEDSEGRIWLATDGGINRFNADEGSFDVYHVVDSAGGHGTNWVYAIEESGDHLWVGSYLGGLHRAAKSLFRPGGGTVVSETSVNAGAAYNGKMAMNMENDFVNKVVRDGSDNIWVLLFRTDSLICIAADGHNAGHDIHALTGGYPDCLAADRLGRVWCGFAGGAAMFDTMHSRARVIRFPGAPAPTLAMGAVGSDMWVSTQSGVWKIDGNDFGVSLLPLPQKGYTAVFGDEATGKVYLGGTDEILETDPVRLCSDTDSASPEEMFGLVLAADAPGIVPDLSDIRRGMSGLSIPYAGSITLTVSTLDYSPQAVQRYSWRLARADEPDTADISDWIVLPEGTNTITLSDLTSGRYNILVRAIGSPGAGRLSIPLEVGRPWYLTAWAICLWIFMACAIAGGVIIYTRRRDRRRMSLRERRKALADVERKLSFLADISHDLKTPLSMILGPVSELREHTSDPGERHTLSLVYDNAVRLNNMIHRTLELNHLDDGTEDLLILSRIDAAEFCRDITATFKENHPGKRFVFHSAARRACVDADAVKLESVLANLLSNACKYSGPAATISVGVDCDGPKVEITVADDGIGIAESDRQLVFQRMYRAPEAARSAEGTGIGLYLIKKYMQMMGGDVDLYSRPGQGSAFTVTLPAATETADDSGQTPDSETEGARRILVVEDNRQIAEFVCRLLRSAGYSCLTADNGRAGLAVAASFSPDLVIADEMMPVMKGSEMVEQMRRNPRLAHIPAIMLTARDDAATESESLKAGADAFMSKPFEPRILLERVRALMEARERWRRSERLRAITTPKPVEAESVTERQLALIARTVEENISDPDLNVNTLCEKSGIPNKQLYRIIKKYTGIAPLDYIRQVRLQKAAMLLSQHRFTVSEVCYMVGFKTPSYFAKCFLAKFGVKPSRYSDDTNPASVPTAEKEPDAADITDIKP